MHTDTAWQHPTITYLTDAPGEPIPPGRVVAHNHVRPASPLGRNGFPGLDR